MRTLIRKEVGSPRRVPREVRQSRGWKAAEIKDLGEGTDPLTRAEKTINLRQRVPEKARACIEVRKPSCPEIMDTKLPMAAKDNHRKFEKRLRALRRLRFKTDPLENPK